MELKDRLAALVRTLPPAQRAGIVAAVLVLVMAAIPFVRWVTTPSYALLYAGLSDTELAQVTNELDAQGVRYELDGSRVLVPQDQLYRTRATLAEAGITSTPSVPGYELLDEQALGVSDFRQRVDLQRAVEGELARTLASMDTIESATVRLVLPEDSLFTEQQSAPSASVLVRPVRDLNHGEIESITLLVAAAVEDLSPDDVTVADTSGTVLHAPGDGAIGGITDRQQRFTREFEQALAADAARLLQNATDAPVSVVVRATLNFDEFEEQSETFADEGTTLREQTENEQYEGTTPIAGGTVGVDGGPILGGGGDGTYEREEATREFGVDRTTTRLLQAPGSVEQLSVALVVDEAAPIANAELEELVAAAVGLDEARGDQVAITRVAIPAVPDDVAVEEPGGIASLLPQIAALLVLLLVALAFFLMARRRRDAVEPLPEKVVPATVQPQHELDDATSNLRELERVPSAKDEVAALVERQPEEIAALLRSWLADRRQHS